MKIVKKENSIKYKNSESCTTFEYLLNEKSINCGLAIIKGRYPDNGFCVNTKCKEIIYIISGNGTIYTKDNNVNFKKNDMILIDQNEPYYWNGNCKVLMSCSPAWEKEQYKIV